MLSATTTDKADEADERKRTTHNNAQPTRTTRRRGWRRGTGNGTTARDKSSERAAASTAALQAQILLISCQCKDLARVESLIDSKYSDLTDRSNSKFVPEHTGESIQQQADADLSQSRRRLLLRRSSHCWRSIESGPATPCERRANRVPESSTSTCPGPSVGSFPRNPLLPASHDEHYQQHR